MMLLRYCICHCFVPKKFRFVIFFLFYGVRFVILFMTKYINYFMNLKSCVLLINFFFVK